MGERLFSPSLTSPSRAESLTISSGHGNGSPSAWRLSPPPSAHQLVGSPAPTPSIQSPIHLQRVQPPLGEPEAGLGGGGRASTAVPCSPDSWAQDLGSGGRARETSRGASKASKSTIPVPKSRFQEHPSPAPGKRVGREGPSRSHALGLGDPGRTGSGEGRGGLPVPALPEPPPPGRPPDTPPRVPPHPTPASRADLGSAAIALAAPPRPQRGPRPPSPPPAAPGPRRRKRAGVGPGGRGLNRGRRGRGGPGRPGAGLGHVRAAREGPGGRATC